MAERVALAETAAGWIARSRQEAADRGAVWVSDRYADCHLAVDAVSRTPDPARLLQVLADLYLARPTVTVWLDLDPRIARERILRRGHDEESLEYLVSLRDAYLALDAATGYVHIPADRPLEEVHERVWSVFASVSASGPPA
ncbi:dTMP kinase [Actinoallomurus sp. CA-142502]|uniref:dTMP kinase n=1 Tax=Actinoallomurus sp. CA-142502 TaxID=3239885 RepID=UPI003D89C6CA